MNPYVIASYLRAYGKLLTQLYLPQTEQFTVLWILFATIVLGNSAVLVTLYINKRKSRMNYFIRQLAFAGEYSGRELKIWF